MGGKAIIHINGAEYVSAGQFTDENGSSFQSLRTRIENLLENPGAQIQTFDVVIQGRWGQLLVRPDALATAAIAFVPE